MIHGGDATIAALWQSLSQASRRTQVIASNLANLDTPGYRALDVEFPEFLEGLGGIEPRRTHAGHLGHGSGPPTSGTLVEAPFDRQRNDGNTVDVDREMTRFAMSQGQYRSAAEMLRKRFALIAYAATDGRQ